MSIERMSGQGYAPIPQSMSNTDTEEEDERLAVPIDNVHEDVEKMRDTIVAQENGWCHSTNDGRNFGKDPIDSQGGYRYCGDEVPIMVAETEVHDDFWKRRDMSTLRRCCLVLSILLCFATVLVFLYVLPCDNTAICPPVVGNQPVITWDKTLEGIELHGPISIVHGTPYSLIFLLRGQHFGANGSAVPSTREIPSDGGGVLSMQGNTGTPLWWVPLKKLPTNIDCSTFDMDGSESPDCIVTGNELLVGIDPRAGMIHWTSTLFTNSQLPLFVPDVDSDGIDDLLAVTNYGFPQGGIVLISGKTGKFLGEYRNSDCDSYGRNSIQLTRLESNYDISYTCKEKKSPKQTLNLTIPLNDLLHVNDTNLQQVRSNYVSNQSAILRIISNMYENFDDYALDLTPYYRLNVQNQGVCPGENCRIRVNVTLQKNGVTNRVIWEHSSNNSYAMKPAVYALSENRYVTGFAIKFWQWDNEKEVIWDETDGIIKRRLIERVQMVLVNYTDVHVINASQSEIIQLCRKDDCQPSLELQRRSIAVADLGADGTWELINYQSSYNNEIPLVLKSRVQIVKLDTDLSQLTQHSFN